MSESNNNVEQQLSMENLSISDTATADIIIEENITTTNVLNKNSVSQSEEAKEKRRYISCVEMLSLTSAIFNPQCCDP